MLFHHVTRSRARRYELRLDDRFQWHHKFFDLEIGSVFSISILRRKRSHGIEYDVDAPDLVHDAVDVFVDGSVIEGISHCRVRTAAGGCDLLRYVFHIRARAAGKKDLRAFGRELLRNRSPIEPPAPNTTACFSCRISELLMGSSIDLSFCLS